MPEIGEKPADFFLDYGIALTGARFEPFSVQHGEMSTPVSDEACGLQPPRRLGDAFAPHSQHVGDEFLGDYHLFLGRPSGICGISNFWGVSVICVFAPVP